MIKVQRIHRAVCHWVLVILAITCGACAAPRPKVSGELAWVPADTTEIAVSPGDVLRITSAGPVAVTEVLRSVEGELEVVRHEQPSNGSILLRASLGTSSFRVPTGTTAHTGMIRDPEIAWFDLERDALSWAASPLGTPFPELAAAPRLDPADPADLDAVLREPPDDPDVRSALRGLMALRSIRALEGVRRYPYARNEELPLAGKTRDIEERAFVELRPDAPLSVTVDGPAALAVSVRVTRGATDALAEVRVLERTHVRGSARGNIRRLEAVPPPPRAGHETDDPTLALLRQVFVHVPPGRHEYSIAANGAPAWIAAMRSAAFLRIEDAASDAKKETALLGRARHACERSGSACALALAFAGEDDGSAFAAAASSASPLAKKLAARISAGAPNDRAAALEAAASGGDNGAIATLARETGATVDPSLRDAWWRGTARGTVWRTVDDESQPPTWFAFLPRAADASTCTASPKPEENELDARPFKAFALPWRRVRAVRILAVTPCTSAEPIQLEVDGQTLTAQPSAGRALWHVIVKAETATVRRIDKGPGHVYALSDDACSGHGTLVRAALPLTESREVVLPKNAASPAVEVWLEEGTQAASLTITQANGARLDVNAHAERGALVALDEQGVRWRRAGHVPLSVPGGRVGAAAGAAVRAVYRDVDETDVPLLAHAQPPDVDALVAVSKKLVAARSPAARGAAALERALLLASYGAERAALEDAELARSLGGKEDVVASVRRAILPLPPTPLDIGTSAYGVEPDFDPKAARCRPSDGPRAKVAALDERLRLRSKTAPYDRALAMQAASVANGAPHDPRADSLVTLATTSSKWKLVHDVEGGGGRNPVPREKEQNPILDSDGRLRPRIHAGDPFGERFVSVTADRPAKAFLADIQRAKAHLDIVCVPRRGGDGERCPLKIAMGGVPVAYKLGEDSRLAVDLPPGRGRGKGAELEVSLKPTRGDWTALVRVVFDREAIGSTQVPGVGWVLDTPHVQYRFLLPAGKPIRVKVSGLVRVDALPEGGPAEVVAVANGQETAIPTTGEPKTLPVSGELVVTARSGAATLAIAERVDAEARTPDGDLEPRTIDVRQGDPTAARVLFDRGRWREVAEASPRPLGGLEDAFGTLDSQTGANVGTYREGTTTDNGLDAYAFESLMYRRRIESLNLYTLAGGLVRARNGDPTYAGTLSAYADLDVLRLRVSGALGAFVQHVDRAETTLRPRGFIEYSGRLSSDVFFLPRIGYDGFYTTLAAPPPSARFVDDDVFNAFRFRRKTFAFFQGLLWYVPFFNDIFYVRVRGTYDVGNGALSHMSARPGAFFIFRALEIAGYFDAQYYVATAGARTSSSIDSAVGGGVVVHLPVTPGSFEIRPGVTTHVRTDGSFQLLGGITISGSYRRGARDYSSLELSFPEETSGGIPWRASNKGP